MSGLTTVSVPSYAITTKPPIGHKCLNRNRNDILINCFLFLEYNMISMCINHPMLYCIQYRALKCSYNTFVSLQKLQISRSISSDNAFCCPEKNLSFIRIMSTQLLSVKYHLYCIPFHFCNVFKHSFLSPLLLWSHTY